MGFKVNDVVNGIRVIVCEDSDAASRTTADLIADQLRERPQSVLGLATGGTPLKTYENLIELHRDGQISFAEATSFNLDEYVGLSGDHPQSYRSFMNQTLFSKVDIAPERTHVPDGLASDVPAHCTAYEDSIQSHGGIDLQLLGIGHNGHIAFNEPGSSADSRTRRVDLTDDTIEKNARFFDSPDEVPREAITMGIATILQAKKIVLLAIGSGKTAAIKSMLFGEVTDEVPASFLRQHVGVTVVLDAAAADGLFDSQ
ncbi:glucosamine-6-phosphate deaminase [Roseiconus lacunae]|uniref:glucosamine-6-phosphate deaminase n=1 Tax=Roseiconus lacunae TaxID=2605694 RepID=UPI001E315F28|nr:glucosamine-6-phosphate deaminase [Roseiconus lacunae]MCD0463160.1 glucosamine-6-phosphate deaminase [Roseiconus lacunae]